MASLMVVGALPLRTMTPQSLNFSSRLSASHSETLGLSLSLPRSTATASTSLSATSSLPFVYCGRGDKKTEKGKRFKHSFGNSRPKSKKKGRGPPRIPLPPSPVAPKKDEFEDDEVVKIEIDESLFSS